MMCVFFDLIGFMVFHLPKFFMIFIGGCCSWFFPCHFFPWQLFVPWCHWMIFPMPLLISPNPQRSAMISLGHVAT